MLSLVWLLILTMMTMVNSDANSGIIIKSSGDSVVLQPGLPRDWMGPERDLRWTHLTLLLNNRTRKCPHGRCELMKDGSLKFSQVQVQDSGNYTLEVFDETGVMKDRTVFLLEVKDVQISGYSDVISRRVRTSSIICCCLMLSLLLFFVIFFMLLKRAPRSTTLGQTENNIYMVMHRSLGNKGIHVEEGKKKEEEALYVPCHPVVPGEQPEDVYI